MNSGADMHVPKLLAQAVRRAIGCELAPVIVVQWVRGPKLSRYEVGSRLIRDMRLGAP